MLTFTAAAFPSNRAKNVPMLTETAIVRVCSTALNGIETIHFFNVPRNFFDSRPVMILS
jgi:hypothetical protein